MNGNVILAAAMNIEIVAKVFLRHGGAFDVPSREAAPPRRVPFHLPALVGGRKLPQSEVGGVSLLPHLHPLSGEKPCPIEASDFSVRRKLGSIEIDAIRCPI